MKVRIPLIFAVAMAICLFGIDASAQIMTPQPSPMTTIETKVGLTDVKINYSRPGMRGRTIYGDLVPYGQVWRTGANSATVITFSDDVKLAGNAVAAGSYSLYSIPQENEWTIILNSNTKGNIGNYSPDEDVIRFKVKPGKITEASEAFTIDFGNFSTAGAHLNIYWANTKVSIPVETEVDSKVMAQIKEQILDNPEPDVRYLSVAANYYLENGKDLDQALKWMDKSLEASPNAFWNLHTKAKILAAQGKNKEAIKVAEASMKMAQESERGDFGYVKNNQDLIASLKKK